MYLVHHRAASWSMPTSSMMMELRCGVVYDYVYDVHCVVYVGYVCMCYVVCMCVYVVCVHMCMC